MGPKGPGRKEKLAAKAAQLEAQRREQEEKEEQERLEQERLQELERARQEKKKREEQEIFEKSVRDEILQGTCDFFNELIDKNFDHKSEMREKEEWETYLDCDRLPYPNDVPSMNTYLYLWQATEETAEMENVFEKNETMLKLLNLLEDYIDEPLDAGESKSRNWREVRENYRKELRSKMDLACFKMIRDIDGMFRRINYWEAEFQKESPNIRLHMWAWMVKTVAPSLSRPAPSKTCYTVSVRLPSSYSKSLLILRVLHTIYDHFSDQCRTWAEPNNPVDHDLYDEVTMWHDIKTDLIKENFEALKKAEEVPCWFEIPEEYLEVSEVETSGALTDREEDAEERSTEKLTDDRTGFSLLRVLSSLEKHKEPKKTECPNSEEDNAEILPEETAVSKKEEPEEELSFENIPREEVVSSKSHDKKVYTGTFPVDGRPEYYRITTNGEIEVIKTTGNYDLELTEEDNTEKNEFLDWVSLRDSVEIEDDFILETIFGDESNNSQTKNSEGNVRTLVDLLKEVTPRAGSLATLNMSEETRTKLSEMLGIQIKSEKGKDAEFDYEPEKVYKPLKTLLEEAQTRYLEAYRKELTLKVEENELNLRKYAIIGGVYHIDLVHQVPQPHSLKDGTILQIHYGDYNIRKENFYFKYIPPMITEEEENEDDDGKPPVDDDIDKLIYVEIQVSEAVLWFETPAPYLWDEEKKIWTSENIYDVRFNEEKQVVSFRIGRTCPIGIATFRFYNLPYQTWEIRPAPDWKESKSIIFSLTASTVIVEYLIQADKVSLTSIQNATGAALDEILGIPFPPNQLMRVMRQAGLDLFPGWDAFLYVEGNSAKKKVLEEHVYLSMSMFSPSYQFTWSRWNLPAGSDRIVFQIRECLKPKDLGSYSMMLSTSHRSVFVNCTEVSPQFTEDASKEMAYQPDLFNLLENTASDKAKKRAKKTNYCCHAIRWRPSFLADVRVLLGNVYDGRTKQLVRTKQWLEDDVFYIENVHQQYFNIGQERRMN